jgi:hypothetical protein
VAYRGTTFAKNSCSDAQSSKCQFSRSTFLLQAAASLRNLISSCREIGSSHYIKGLVAASCGKTASDLPNEENNFVITFIYLRNVFMMGYIVWSHIAIMLDPDIVFVDRSESLKELWHFEVGSFLLGIK